ncbi:unnamed protein product [Hymenolepis diminuta]|uniref:MMS1_N domain-containing protein n=1 Tax=Hymenolepis diminuta TaxID=6216 RepID=A0A0R3STL2_HYMDI|nr:unnamed protein product [Hymenolepis diminuta]
MWLAEARKTARTQPIASSLMPPSSSEAKRQFTEYAYVKRVFILNREGTEVEIEHQLPVRGWRNIVAFQDKLVFIGVVEYKNGPPTISLGSKRVDVMDISTGQVSSLSDMIKAISNSVDSLGTALRIMFTGLLQEGEIFFIFIFRWPLCLLVALRVKELLPPTIWSLLSPMIEERSCSAAVNIPDYGVLVIGGMGRNRLTLRSTELLTRRSDEVRGEGGEKKSLRCWLWRNRECDGDAGPGNRRSVDLFDLLQSLTNPTP